MYRISKDDITKFMEYYHYFNGSYISVVNYNVLSNKIYITIDISWAGKAKLKDDGTLDKNSIKMKMRFNGVKQFRNNKMSSDDFIDRAFLQYIKIDDKLYICFATDEGNPLLYIVADSMEFEEIVEII